jgi:hypothetical protein
MPRMPRRVRPGYSVKWLREILKRNGFIENSSKFKVQGSKFGGYRLLLSHLQAFGSSSLKILFVAALLTLNLEL